MVAVVYCSKQKKLTAQMNKRLEELELDIRNDIRQGYVRHLLDAGVPLRISAATSCLTSVTQEQCAPLTLTLTFDL